MIGYTIPKIPSRVYVDAKYGGIEMDASHSFFRLPPTLRLFFCSLWLLLFLIPSIEGVETREPRLLLITGCGRSGTQYIFKVLRQSGIDVTHEHTMGLDGCVSWLMAAHVDWAPWGPLSKKYAFKHIFHQVREPTKVIQSVFNVPPSAGWKWIMRSIPEILDTDSALTKCAKYWYYWNLMAEEQAEWTYRIEEIDAVYSLMGKKLGKKFNTETPKNISKKSNSKGAPKYVITWKTLYEELDPDLYEKVYSLAYRYGYSVLN